jgi:hypothetical protein
MTGAAAADTAPSRQKIYAASRRCGRGVPALSLFKVLRDEGVPSFSIIYFT